MAGEVNYHRLRNFESFPGGGRIVAQRHPGPGHHPRRPSEPLEHAGFLFDVPTRYTPQSRIVPTAEECVPGSKPSSASGMTPPSMRKNASAAWPLPKTGVPSAWLLGSKSFSRRSYTRRAVHIRRWLVVKRSGGEFPAKQSTEKMRLLTEEAI
jgi:hypothetical protein